MKTAVRPKPLSATKHRPETTFHLDTERIQTVRQKKKHHDQKLREIEESVYQNQFRERWSNKKHNLALRNGNTWKDLFEKLRVPNNLSHEQKQIQEKLMILESTIKTNQNPLDYVITMKEFEDRIENSDLGKHVDLTASGQRC